MAKSSPSATWWEKWHHAFLAVAELLLAILLASFRDRTTRGPLYHFLKNGRATVALVVQIVSSILGTGNLYVLRSVVGHYARRKLTRSPMSLDRFAFWVYLGSGSFDFSLSPWCFFIALTVSILSFGPAALWAGAITPTIAVQDCELTALGARFSPETRGLWDVQFKFYEEAAQVWNYFNRCVSDTINGGLYTNCPVPTLNDNLLGSAVAEASSTPDQDLQPPATAGGTSYSSLGRSYGVGNIVGLAPGITGADLEARMVESFTFHEPGYETTVTCIKNTSSALGFIHHRKGDNTSVPNIWALAGRLPNTILNTTSSVEFYPITTWRDADFENMTAWSAVYNPYTSTSFLSIASGPRKYAMFNRTQCQFTFTPKIFRVEVNVTSRAILRTPLPSHPVDLPPLDPLNVLPSLVTRSLNLLSRMKSSLYISELGESLHSALKGYTSAHSTSPSEEATLHIASLFFTSLADSLLSAYSTSQILLVNDTQPLNVISSSCKAVSLGPDFYMFIVLGMNLFIVGVVLVGLTMTKCWTDLPGWDPLSVRDLVVAAVASERGRVWKRGEVERLKLVWKGGGVAAAGAETGWCLEATHDSGVEGEKKGYGGVETSTEDLLPLDTIAMSKDGSPDSFVIGRR